MVIDLIQMIRGPMTVLSGAGLTIGVMALMLWMDRDIW